MAGPKQVPEPWRSFLEELDQRAIEETRMDCMGGFVVTVLYGFSRETNFPRSQPSSPGFYR